MIKCLVYCLIVSDVLTSSAYLNPSIVELYQASLLVCTALVFIRNTVDILCTIYLIRVFLPLAQPVNEADSVSSGDLPAQSERTGSAEISRADSETEAFEFLRVLSSLSGFEIKLFRDEPELV